MAERDYYEEDGLQPNPRKAEIDDYDPTPEKQGVCGECGEDDYLKFDYNYLKDVCGSCSAKWGNAGEEEE